MDLAHIWIDLERQSLSELIGDRLEVLEPIILQVKRVADAGIGDVTQVAAAQRTVSVSSSLRQMLLKSLKVPS